MISWIQSKSIRTYKHMKIKLHLPFKILRIPSQYEDEPKPEKSPRFWRKAFMGLSFAYIAAGLLLMAFLVLKIFIYPKIKTCADYANRAQAQKALPKHPNLDGDQDGIACEHLKKT